MGHSGCGSFSTSMIFSHSHLPASDFQKWITLADRAAPQKPWVLSGSWWNLTSNGISPSSPRYMVSTGLRASKSQICRRRPYFRCPTSSRSNPGMNVFGAAHSEDTMTLWRGWYQKS